MEKSRTNDLLKKSLKITVVICIILVISFFLYWGILHPLLEHGNLPRDRAIWGIEYYLDDSYKDLPKGTEFADSVANLPILQAGEITDFYYIDNHKKANPLYGKIPDVYALKIVYPSDVFNEVYTSIKADSIEKGNADTHQLYSYQYYDDNLYFFSVDESTSGIYYLMAADASKDCSLHSLLLYHTHLYLDWD